MELDDGHGVVIGDGQNTFSSVGGTDAEVVHAACSADAHFAVCRDVVVAEPVVARPVVAGGDGFGQGRVGRRWCVPSELAVGPVMVVDVAESVELGLELGQGGGGGLCGEPSFLCLVEPFDLALGLGGGWVCRSSG